MRPPLVAAARLVPLAALLGIPVLVGMHALYPIGQGSWFSPVFFVARSVAFLLIWSVLALLYPRTTLARRKALSAIGLIAYVFTVSIAAMDWFGALMPEWYSTGFGLVVASGQMLGAMALAVAWAGLRGPRQPRGQVFIDLGNLLLMYVLLWAYLAFMEFLIIWVGNLPREIAWYVPRVQTGWRWLGIALVLVQLAIPFTLLLLRKVKDRPARLGAVAALLLAATALDTAWLVLPSVDPHDLNAWWLQPLAVAGMALFLFGPAHRAEPAPVEPQARHA